MPKAARLWRQRCRATERRLPATGVGPVSGWRHQSGNVRRANDTPLLRTGPDARAHRPAPLETWFPGATRGAVRDDLRTVSLTVFHRFPSRAAVRRGRGNPLVKPSMCSFRSGDIFCQRGSRMNCTPSRRANFAAGTKSASPETRMMMFACPLSVSDAISNPIRISTPFCRKAGVKSSSVKSSTAMRRLRRAFCGSASRIQDRFASFRTSPRRTAIFRELRRASKSCFRKRA